MPLFDDPVKQSVDRFFSALDGDAGARKELGLQADGKELAAAGHALRSLSEKTDNELFEDVTKSIAKDPRITKHLPELALAALSMNGELKEDFFITNPTINTDKDQTTISKAEVIAAAGDAKAFDPVHQKALQYVVDNFDRFRNFERVDDSSSVFAANSPNLTGYDLSKALQRLIELKQQPQQEQTTYLKLRALDEIIGEFDKIDGNKSGKISASEGQAWLAKRGEQPGEWIRQCLPASTSRIVKGSELFSLEDLQHKRKQLAAEIQTKVAFLPEAGGK